MEQLTDWVTDTKIPVGRTAKTVFDWLNANAAGLFDAISTGMEALIDAILTGLEAPDAIPMRHATPHFAHVFAGDSYAAGYYSYMWSEVMDADAFAAFAETGDIFDHATARRLEETILSRGGSAPADQLWMAFRGRMPGVDALLKGRGLD